MSGMALLHVTFADAAEAERIAHIVVEERLAACANLLGRCRSIYRWQGAVEDVEEERALFKTAPDMAEALAARIAGLHSYDLPAIEHWTADASTAVRDWMVEATRS